MALRGKIFTSSDWQKCLSSDDDERIFTLVEAAQQQQLDQVPECAEAYAELHAEALRRHGRLGGGGTDAWGKELPKLLLLDYDGTLAPKRTPLSRTMCAHLSWFLCTGGHIALITMQGVGDGGIREYAVQPLWRYFTTHQLDLRRMQQLHLFPGGGLAYYRLDDRGRFDEDRPIYNLGLPGRECAALEARVTRQLRGIATHIFCKRSICTLYFPTQRRFEQGVLLLETILAEYPGLVLEPWCGDKVHRVHVRHVLTSKRLARTIMLHHAREYTAKELGHAKAREWRRVIVVAGDSMGYSPECADDAEMLVLGARNLALGREAVIGAERTYLGTFQYGLDAWFVELRRRFGS